MAELIKHSLKDQIRDLLYDKIVSGELKPGAPLRIIPIAKELGVSQAPVREAIQCLVSSGFCEKKTNVGTRVREYTPEELSDIYELRKTLEIAALKKVTDFSNLGKILKSYYNGMVKATKDDNRLDFSRYDVGFHRAIVEASGNIKFLDVWDSLNQLRLVSRKIEILPMSLKEILAMHVPIYKKLLKGDKTVIQDLEMHFNKME